MDVEKSTEYLNYLRVFAAIAVVLLHVFSIPISLPYQDSYSSVELFYCRCMKYLMMWCVPVFIMITGVLFLNPDKELSLKKLFGKYIFRFVSVILSFGTMFCLMELMFEDCVFSFSKIYQALLNSVTGNSWDHMWYVYMVIGLYMIIPLVKVFVNNVNDKILFYALGILFCTSSLLPYLKNFFSFKNHYSMFSIYVFYLLLGYMIHYKKFQIKKIYSIIILLLFVLYVGIIQCNGIFDINTVARPLKLGYDSPVVVVAAFAIFVLCKDLKRCSQVIRFVVPLTFGIYIIHPLFVNCCNRVLHLTSDKYSLFFSIISVTLITVAGSILLTAALRLIPFVRKHVL